jgi:hypothetical protein
VTRITRLEASTGKHRRVDAAIPWCAAKNDLGTRGSIVKPRGPSRRRVMARKLTAPVAFKVPERSADRAPQLGRIESDGT